MSLFRSLLGCTFLDRGKIRPMNNDDFMNYIEMKYKKLPKFIMDVYKNEKISLYQKESFTDGFVENYMNNYNFRMECYGKFLFFDKFFFTGVLNYRQCLIYSRIEEFCFYVEIE